MKHTKKKIGVGGLEISDYEKQLVNEVLNSNRLTYGPVTKKFEEAFAKLHDCEFALFMNSGTSALHVALAAFKAMHGWHDGDEVLVHGTDPLDYDSRRHTACRTHGYQAKLLVTTFQFIQYGTN